MLDSMFEDAVEGMGTDAIAAAVAGICEEAAPLPAHVQKAADARLALAHDAGRKLVDALTRFSIGSDEVCTNVTDECTTLGGRGYANRPKWTLRDLAAIRYGAKQLKSCSSDGTTPTPLQLAEAVELAALGTTHFELPASVDTVTRTAPPLDSAYVQVFAPLSAAAEALGSTLLARLSTASSNNYGRHGHLWLKLQEWTCNLHPATVVSNQSGPWRPLRKALAGCHTFALNARDDTLADLITDLCTRIDQYKSQVGMVTNVPLLRAPPPAFKRPALAPADAVQQHPTWPSRPVQVAAGDLVVHGHLSLHRSDRTQSLDGSGQHRRTGPKRAAAGPAVHGLLSLGGGDRARRATGSLPSPEPPAEST